MPKLEVKAALTATDTGEITGVAWPFGSGDRVGDIIEKGAFAKAARSLPMLWAHNQGQAIGVWSEIKETGLGLEVKGRLLVDDVPKAREVRALIREGAIGGISIGFIPKKALSRKGGGRTITDLDLAEISIVSVPSHPGAIITSLKDAEHNDMTTPTADDTATKPDAGAIPAAIETKLAELGDNVKGLPALIGRLDKIEAKLNRPGVGKAEDEPEEVKLEKKAFGTYLRRGEAGLVELDRKALTVANNASAGFLAPPEYGNEIVKALVEYSPIRSYAKVVTIAGPEIRFPKRLTGTNAQWVSEIGDRPESSLTYGQVTLTPWEIATFVELSKQLLEDAAYDVEGEVRDALAEDFGQKEGAAFISGDGVGKPKGILVASDIPQIVSGAAATLGSAPGDLLIDAFSKLPTAHAQNGAWLMNRTTLATVRKLKDGQGAYLWQPSIQTGQPSTLLGRPVIEAVDMDNVAAGKFPIVFGDWSGYRIVDRVGVSILVDPFTRATNGITRFHARKRVGGDVTHPDRFVKIKIAAS